jgi:hypothetical protein
VRSDRELWAVFGLPPGADSRDLKKAFRQLTKRYHPDSSKDPATARKFSRVVRVYQLLARKTGQARETPAEPGGTEPEEDLFALGTEFTVSRDARARTEAVKRLGLSGKRSAYIFLRKALYDDSAEVVAQAVRSVALLGIRQAEGEMASLFSRSDAALKRTILETARGTREPVFLSALRAARTDPDPAVAVSAAEILGSLEGC